MLDVFYIKGTYCMDGQCDTYTGEVSSSDIVLGSFSLTSDSGEEAAVNLDIATFNINIAVNDKNGGTIKRELRDLEVTTQGDGSWHIEKDIGSDTFKITIMPS